MDCFIGNTVSLSLVAFYMSSAELEELIDLGDAL